MAYDLTAKTCTPCQGGIPPLSPDQAETFLGDTPGWQLLENAKRIERTFEFKNFKEAWHFVDKVAAQAELEGHHPDITFGWGYVTVSVFTHKIEGLHENDFILAAKINEFAPQAAA
jgi:4a-hydroxytetrahydrobiopterin dehydratase